MLPDFHFTRKNISETSDELYHFSRCLFSLVCAAGIVIFPFQKSRGLNPENFQGLICKLLIGFLQFVPA